MATTRREFLELAGAAAATSLMGGCASVQTCVTEGALPAPPPGLACRSDYIFENWSHTIRFQPRRYCRPRTEADVAALVKDALAQGTHVRTQGAGHSFSQLLPTRDTLLSLDDLERPIRVEGTRVSVPGGMRLKRIIPELRQRGLAFRNLGSITEQSIAGAFSTGTHGTGLKRGAVSTQVVGLRLVDGHGEVREIGEHDVEELAAARINLGALGIITEVTLDCVPDYQLEYSAYLTTFDEVLGEIERLVAENDRFLLWWFVPPFCPRDAVVVITKNPVDAPKGKLARTAAGSGAKLSAKRLSKGERELRQAVRETPAKGFKLIRRYVGPYNEVLTIPLLPVFHRECEYAIPVDRTVEALRAMREVIDEGDTSLLLPVEVRFVAQDDILLSPCNRGPVCYIGATTLVNSSEVFERFEPLMRALGGRPHWGKNFTLTQREVAQDLYPATYERFRAVRERFDPKRVFSNSLLAELFP